MRLTFAVVVFFINSSSAQIINSVSADSTGMYFYSFDSLAAIIRSEKRIERIVLMADQNIIRNFPEKVDGIEVLKTHENFPANKTGPGDALIAIGNLTIIRDEVTIPFMVKERKGKTLTYRGNSLYIFYFKYQPETQSYQLRKIKSGLTL